MDKTILYTFPAEADATEHTVLRLTIGTVTALGMAKYRRYLRESRSWMREQGADMESEEPLTPEQNELWDLCYRRSFMLASLKQVESGTCSPDEEMPSEWKPAELPATWQSMENFIDGDLPGILFNQWDAAAEDANPDTFFVSTTDEKKRKPGSVTVI
jgi:hypothetical protein